MIHEHIEDDKIFYWDGYNKKKNGISLPRIKISEKSSEIFMDRSICMSCDEEMFLVRNYYPKKKC